MAARDFSDWVPITIDGGVVGRTVQRSAIIEASARIVNMPANQHEIPRLTDADVGGGSSLTEDGNDGHKISVYGFQYNGKHTFDEAQTEDTVADELGATGREWLTSFHKAYDSACIGVTGARSATVTDGRPYDSIYRRVRSADADAGYTADTNYKVTVGAAGGQVTYDQLSDTLALVERGEFWNEESGCWLMHPHLKALIRDVEDGSGRKIFVESTAGMPGGGVRPIYHLFNYPVYFTYGAYSSTKYLGIVGGGEVPVNPLLVAVNRAHIVHGKRIEPQSRFIPASQNLNALEHTVQHRARKGFALAMPQAAAVLEVDITL